MVEPEDSQELYLDLFDVIFDFDVEDSLITAIFLWNS